ncbi:MarR family winged helix-turn-helix transcriptional regulator [Lacticaseibacillus mingshuiensis]|uniref:MarR family winged helix-turn-helix transcriptional regulator n=1 Tax=Lacticaseibacillus mingshuiensis TaxID=2799574 RepID=A0ABW4CM58_9LACO|nr:MarR family winged helix-turn-helix transcriptional regulator [Lacticaseibacillus mingshuiensis]
MTQDFGKAIKHASICMTTAMDNYAKQFGLTGNQMSIIDFIGTREVLQREIEAEFGIQRSTTTVTLQRMEKAGLITRTAVAGDTRQKVVRLTSKASRLCEAVAAYIGGQQQAMTSAFSEAEQATFFKMLTAFTQLNQGDAHA